MTRVQAKISKFINKYYVMRITKSGSQKILLLCTTCIVYQIKLMEENCKIKRWDILKSKLNNLSPEEFVEFMAKHPDVVLIDCRKPDEHRTIYIPNSLNYDYLGEDFWEEMEILPLEKTYLVYCNSSRRSIRTCTLMQNGGFKQVYNLDGGLNRWVEELGEQGLERPKE
jgi:rhodanese-related sulfurtransferase